MWYFNRSGPNFWSYSANFDKVLSIRQYAFEKCKEQASVHRFAMKAYGKEEYDSNHS